MLEKCEPRCCICAALLQHYRSFTASRFPYLRRWHSFSRSCLGGELEMVRKSVWLLSAGLFALSAPAQAQETPAPETDTDQTAAQPTDGATAEAAAVDNEAVEQQSAERTH